MKDKIGSIHSGHQLVEVPKHLSFPVGSMILSRLMNDTQFRSIRTNSNC
jgi:hypothetical protein